ncbi:hypothetical protein ABFT23_09205 [Nocardioides sp. C4-1]|uniref:hypothetical protein n=1 Tax=Nocardioides sp. C4-1 TaxID=3151851 RepID=UPI003263FCB7
MKITRLALPSAALVVALAATTSGAATAAPAPVAAQTPVAANSSDEVDAANQARYDHVVSLLPANWEQRRDAARQRFGIDHSPVEDVLAGKMEHAEAQWRDGAAVIDPTDYECGPTALDGYVDGILADVDPFSVLLLSLLGGLDVPTYEALLFGSPKDADFAVAADYRERLTTSFGYNQRFWDVKLSDVQLLGMHGEMITDLNRSARTLEFLYGVGPADAVEIATTIAEIVESDPALDGGAHPLFTLNAFAFTGEGDPDPVIRKLKDKVVFGDGILDAMKSLGLGKTGPDAVLAHEVAHHVQYENDLFDSDLDAPEATRRTELMADGFGTYFAVHKKGLGIKPAQVLEVAKSFAAVGDCSFTSPGHHGTPNQRRAASAWGAAEVAYSNNPQKVLPSLKLAQRFEKILPELVAPDAPTTVQGFAPAA